MSRMQVQHISQKERKEIVGEFFAIMSDLNNKQETQVF